MARKFGSRLNDSEELLLEELKRELNLGSDRELLLGLAERVRNEIQKAKENTPAAVTPTSTGATELPEGHYEVPYTPPVTTRTFREILDRIGYTDKLYPRLWYTPLDVNPVSYRYIGSPYFSVETVRTRALELPVGGHMWTTNGWSMRPWYIPQCRLEEFASLCKPWIENGAVLRICEPLPYDWAGNGCRYHPNRRVEPALEGEVMVYLEVEDMNKLWNYMQENTNVPCYLCPDIELYNTNDAYKELVDLWSKYYSHYYEHDAPLSLTEDEEEPVYFF